MNKGEILGLADRDRRTLSDPQRLLWRDDVEGIYKTAGPYPVTPDFAGFLISPFRSSARSWVRESAIRCKSHLRAVVAFFFAKRRPQTRLLPRRGLAHDEGSIA